MGIKKSKRNNLVMILIGIIAVLVIAVVILVLIRPKADAVPASLEDAANELEENKMLTTIELSKLTEQVSELTTQKYYYKDIHEEKVEKEGLFSSEKLTLIVYEGTIHAGINLEEVDYKIDNEAKKITVILPEPKILSHEFDSDKVRSYDVKKKAFSKELSYEDSAKKFNELEKIKEEAVMQDEEFLKSVVEDTKTTLTNFFTISDLTKDYTVDFIENLPEQKATDKKTTEVDSEDES